jgi:hypothetical protein
MRQRDAALGTRGAFIAGSLMAAATVLVSYTCALDLVGVQDVRWDKGRNVTARVKLFLLKRKSKYSIGKTVLYTRE